MVIDYAPKLDGHDVKSKIGIITGTEIKHSCIGIISLFYVLDFRSEVEKIKKEQEKICLSLENDLISVADLPEASSPPPKPRHIATNLPSQEHFRW